jgi:hypothetical protein
MTTLDGTAREAVQGVEPLVYSLLDNRHRAIARR